MSGHIHDVHREIRAIAGSPDHKRPKDEQPPWVCPSCNGRTFHPHYLGVSTRDESDLFDHDSCELCHGTGYVCPCCRGARHVVRGSARKMAPCPICSNAGKYSRYLEAKAILAAVEGAEAEVLF